MNEAVILAAGKGSRMNMPGVAKALVPVNGRPLISYAIDALIKYGIKVIWIVKYHLDSYELLDKMYSQAGIELRYIEDYERKGSLYSFSLISQYVKNEFICMDCDVYVEVEPFCEMLNRGLNILNEEKLVGVMAYVSNPSKEDADMISMVGNRVVRFIKSGDSYCKRGGYIYLWTNRIFDYISDFFQKECYSLAQYFDFIVQQFEVGTMEIEDLWDIDCIDDIEFTSKYRIKVQE